VRREGGGKRGGRGVLRGVKREGRRGDKERETREFVVRQKKKTRVFFCQHTHTHQHQKKVDLDHGHRV